MKIAWRRRLLTKAGVCLFCVAAADCLFHGYGYGANTAIFAALLLLGLLLCGGVPLRTWGGRLLLVGQVGLIAALIEDPGPLPLLLISLGFALLVLTQKHGWTASVPVWLERLLGFGFRGLLQWAADLPWMLTGRRRNSVQAGARHRLRGWLLALVLGAVFLALFCAANPVLADWAGRAMDRALGLVGDLSGVRILRWILVAAAVWALLRARAHQLFVLATPRPDSERPALVSAGTLIRCLALFNLVFLLQNVLDLRYLWLGQALPEGLTYAQYAHRGAFPLIASALLAGGFVLVTFRSGSAERGLRWPRRLVYLFLAQNIFLTVCAMLRLSLYVQAYSLTRLRVAAMLWMLLVVAGLILIALRILARKSNGWLLGANALSVVALLYACCFVDIDGYIANYNVAHCREISGEGQPIDYYYLENLGPEAIPALARLARETSDAKAASLWTGFRLDLDRKTSQWRTWTWRRARLLRDP